jgi:flagellar hook-associated protein 1
VADLLSTGISGVRTYQRALATVGNNIANVDTQGYSRQRLEIQESSSSSEGSLNIGNGARAVRVQRSYDSFVVENLRSSQSQLTKHQATLEYVTQLENILADKQLSLSTSLDGFFSAVQEVSLSPSSTAARQNMLNAAESTVAQFTSVGTQLSSIEENSYTDLTGQVSALNQFADQLASINVSLNRVNSIDKQPNELLDQRDTLIQDMSKLLRVHAVEKNNGAVDIHIGDVASGQYLVQGNKGSTLGIERSATNPDKAVLMLDPFMSPQAVTQVVGGSIAGISEFRQNSLTILRDELDTLTQVFVGQVNDTHALGIDAQGNFGGDLFSVGNIYAVTPGLNKGTGFVTVSALPNAKIERLTMDLTYSDSKKLWTLTDTVSKKAVTGVTELTMGGVKVTLSGVPKDADTFSLTSTKRPIDAMQVSVTEHSNIASGGAVSVTSASTNTSGTRMILNGYVKPTAAVADTTMDTALRNNIAQVAASNLSASNTLAFVIPANTQDSQFYSTEQNGSSNTQMQVFTRAGKQLYGSALSSSEQTALVTSGNGFSSNAAYDSTYSNQTGSNAYMDANVTVTNPTAGDARDYFALAGSLKEDLLVFVTGTGSSEVSGQWGNLATVDVREQLRQNIDVQFAADASTYVLTDTTTNTKLTSGTFTAGSTIEHNGWTVSFDGVIQANDKFSVRGNSAQAGDNRNLLKIIDLQGNKDIFSGRGDFTEVYTDVIGDLGYSVVQSAVSRDAQQIIFDQAQAKRDETSAVSLDEEAANLLRFQQAYQASAQVISTATKLFDTILGIR